MGKPLGVTPAGGGSGFGVSYSAGIGWLKSFRETGSAARGQMGGHRPKTISGEHQDWLVQRCRERDFTLRRWSASRPNAEVDYRSVWAFVHAEKLLYKKGR